MSLLADLLSKKNTTEPSGGKDIPPTLSASHGEPAKVRNLKNRYIVISAIVATTMASGVFVATQYSRLIPLLDKKQAPAPQPIKPPPVVAPAAPVPQAAIVPPQMVEPAKAVTPAAEKKSASKRKTAASKHAQRKRPAATPKLAAFRPAQKAVPLPQAAPVTEASAASGKIDTAKRDALLYTARSAEQVSDWRLALANYRKAQKLDPDNYVIMNNAAAALNNLGMFDEGAKEAKRALSKKPDYVPAMINAAIACSSTGNTQEALRLFSEATIADPGNRNLVINLGILQERTGRLDDARTTYRPLADDGDPLALHGLGRIYERKGNRLEAVRTYRRIMALPNANPALKKEIKGKLVRLEE